MNLVSCSSVMCDQETMKLFIVSWYDVVLVIYIRNKKKQGQGIGGDRTHIARANFMCNGSKIWIFFEEYSKQVFLHCCMFTAANCPLRDPSLAYFTVDDTL